MNPDIKNQERHNDTSAQKTDSGRGCCFGSCDGGAEANLCEGCWKLHAADWLEDYPDNFPQDIFEVRFKNTRRSYYRNVYSLNLRRGDIVAVEASPGHDIGIVSLTGDLVARQMRRIGFNPQNGEFKKIYRKAKPYDIEKWREAVTLEHDTMIKARQIAADMNLNMKIGDVEYQGDKLKAIFYYIADERVDFRELIKVFAEQFRIRIEMKQIGARQEAGRIGGLGSCGRELCCASWVSSFNSVNTNAARAQDLSLNPQKLAGQCSKLKCCLIYELDDYIDARREFPRINGPLQALDGDYYAVKTDILGRTVSFSTAPGSMAGLVTLPLSRVREIMEMNAAGRKPEKLDEGTNGAAATADPGFVNVIGEESITRFDTKKKKKRRRRPSEEEYPQAAAEERQAGKRQQSDSRREGRSEAGKNASRQSGPANKGGVPEAGHARSGRGTEGGRQTERPARDGSGQRRGGGSRKNPSKPDKPATPQNAA